MICIIERKTRWYSTDSKGAKFLRNKEQNKFMQCFSIFSLKSKSTLWLGLNSNSHVLLSETSRRSLASHWNKCKKKIYPQREPFTYTRICSIFLKLFICWTWRRMFCLPRTSPSSFSNYFFLTILRSVYIF